MLEGKKIFVVLPAYNAAATVEEVLDIVDSNDIVDQIILVDDGSSDNTVELARARGLHTVCHGDNRGYGANQKTCYREACGGYAASGSAVFAAIGDGDGGNDYIRRV